MKTHFFLMSTVVLLGATVLTTSYAATTSEYLHFTRHRDSQGNLLMAPTQPHSETSVMQKTMMPSQLKTFERRSTDWGMSAQDVKANEPVQPLWELQTPVLAEYEQRVAYQTQIEGLDAALTYTFYEGHLGQAKYVFEPQHDDAVDYVQDFHIVKKWITQSYGLPTFVQDIWLNTLYQYDQSLWGQAVLRGQLVMVAEWKQPGTDIVLVLDGGEDMIGLVADFASTTFVVPVLFDGGSVEASVEEGMEETTIQKALPAESMDDVNQEDSPVQEALIEQAGLEEHPSDTEVVSNTSTELDEIEAMLNEEFPELEPLEPMQVDAMPLEEQAGELVPEGHNLNVDSQATMPLEEQAGELVPEGHNLNVDSQASMPLEEQAGELVPEGHNLNVDSQATMPLEEQPGELVPEGHNLNVDSQATMPLEEQAGELVPEGHNLNVDSQASMPLDELAPDTLEQQALLPESTPQVEEAMGENTMNLGDYSQTSEQPISNVSENVAEGLEEMPLEHAASDDSVGDHFIVDHVNEPVLEIEAELEGYHL